MKKEIIFFKLKKPEYKKAAEIIVYGKVGFVSSCGSFVFKPGSINAKKLEEAGVLDLWFEPVYKEKPEVGDSKLVDKTPHIVVNNYKVEFTKDQIKEIVKILKQCDS